MFVEKREQQSEFFLKQKVIYYIIFVTYVLEGGKLRIFWGLAQIFL
jgi:hypothetical protein